MNNDSLNNASEDNHAAGSQDSARDHAGPVGSDQVQGDQVRGDKIGQQINSEGGAVFSGPVHAADDVIGGDQINIYYITQTGQPAEKEFTWQHLLQNSRKQLGLFWRAAMGKGDRPGIYVPELYVSSNQADAELEAFLYGDAAALIILGETGIGKTNLLCHWTSLLSQAGHAVFFYDCAGSIHDNLEIGLARDLGAANADELHDVLNSLSEMAAANGRSRLFLIFDAINEFRRPNQVGTAHLLRQIDALIGRLPARNVKVIFSCRTVPWRQMQNTGKTQLLWHNYHQPQGSGESFLLLQHLDAATFALAYEKYRAHFNLQTEHDQVPPALREKLMRPYFLRMLAEAYSGRGIPVTQDSLLLNIFKRFYEERITSLEDQKFMEDLVEVMYESNSSNLWIDDLQANPDLYAKLLSEDPDSSYQRMLARGVLSETPGDFFQSAQVRFLYDPLGSYTLARLLYRRDRDGSHLTTLVCEKRDFHLAWEAALILLLVQPSKDNFAKVAGSQDPDLRELAVTALQHYHADQPQAALDVLTHLLQQDSTEAQYTALKAAYFIGPAARTIFLDIACNPDRDLRQVTKDAIYLNWRADPQFVSDLFDALVERIDLKSPRQTRYVLEFIIDLSITIYINNCDDAELPQQISDLYYELIKNRLRLDLLDIGFLGPTFGKLISAAVGSAMARPVMNAFQYSESTTLYRDTYVTAADKERLKRVLYLIEPGSDLAPEVDNIAGMLQEEITVINILAALPLAVQAVHDFPTTEPLLRQLFERVNGHGRVWIISSLVVQFKPTPPQWVPLLEEFTRRLIAENPETYHEQRGSFLQDFDIVLLPLGLAYGKQGSTMPLFEELLRQGLAGEQQLLSRTLAALGPVGFYHPQSIFDTLVAAIGEEKLAQAEIQEMLVEPLSLMRILHLDQVDAFLQRIEAGEAFKRRVAAATDINKVSGYIYRLGVYNSTVYDALYHPQMRRNFFIGSMEVLIDKQEAKAFIKYYTEAAIRMSREANYHIIEWTRPD
jgi:hypothetical protein